MNDNVTRPFHYTQGTMECIDYIEDQRLGFHEATAVQYIVRARYKGTEIEDLKKAQWYLGRKIQQLEKEDLCKTNSTAPRTLDPRLKRPVPR